MAQYTDWAWLTGITVSRTADIQTVLREVLPYLTTKRS